MSTNDGTSATTNGATSGAAALTRNVTETRTEHETTRSRNTTTTRACENEEQRNTTKRRASRNDGGPTRVQCRARPKSIIMNVFESPCRPVMRMRTMLLTTFRELFQISRVALSTRTMNCVLTNAAARYRIMAKRIANGFRKM